LVHREISIKPLGVHEFCYLLKIPFFGTAGVVVPVDALGAMRARAMEAAAKRQQAGEPVETPY
jgi:hypothetical protein